MEERLTPVYTRHAVLLLLALSACSGSDSTGTAQDAAPADASADTVLFDAVVKDATGDDSALSASCSDGLENGTETDVDCGGACPKCASGKSCAVGADCASGYCNAAKTCATKPATCSDGLKSGTETDIDCGGTCPECANGKSCTVAADCASSYCNAVKTCATKPATCKDGVKNAAETDIDCGGNCPKCANGKSCSAAADCASGYCDAASACEAKPSCNGGNVYDCVVRADGPVSYYQYIAVNTLYDVVNNRNGQTVGPVGAKAFAGFPATSKDNAPNFTTSSYISIPDHSAFSISTTGTLTLEFWLRPSTLLYSFASTVPAASKYLYALGKGDSADYEYGIRFYSSDAVPNRANAISAYVWNTSGGLGSGATSVTGLKSTNEWIHFVAIYTDFGPHGPDTSNNGFNAAAYPGTIKLWRNGVLESSGFMSQFGINPANDVSPLQLGRRGSSDGTITYAGAVGKLAIYNKALSTTQILTHYKTAFLK